MRDRQACVEKNYQWVDSPVNFDHIFNAYFSLVEVASFKGWIHLINDAVDSHVSRRFEKMLELCMLLNTNESVPQRKLSSFFFFDFVREKFRTKMHLYGFDIWC